MSSPAWQALQERMCAGQITRLKEAQAYLQQDWSIAYHVSGLSRLFQRRQVKLKTGRRQHRKTSVTQQELFKKTSGKRWSSVKPSES
ncbi:winged helix-turn-helix domain-containing protein [Candidatus Acetothermia bacterium]|nr:winged helix-turn-helix domain-containing protein [Candidatus Acetothermia bacterium]